MTDAESRFVTALRRQLETVQIWLHTTEHRPWLIASVDVVRDRHIERTWRIDFDQSAVEGGLSPASLNWDDGVSASEAGINTDPPLGLPLTTGTPEDLAELVAEWFSAVTATS
jgi:hypothetical protein